MAAVSLTRLHGQSRSETVSLFSFRLRRKNRGESCSCNRRKKPKWVTGGSSGARGSATTQDRQSLYEVASGDQMLTASTAGTDIKLGGTNSWLLSEKDILAIVH